MNILAIDTSTMLGTVALVANGKLLGQIDLDLPITHTKRILKGIDTLLKLTGINLSKIDTFAITKGPGSFTGIRIGIVTVKGLAYALNKPLVSVVTLDALARNFLFAPYLICPMIDAKKEEVFSALYVSRQGKIEKIYPCCSIKPINLIKKIKRKTIFAGTGAVVYKTLIEKNMKDLAIFPPCHLNRIQGEVIAHLALEQIILGKIDDSLHLAPFYIRPSDAELRTKLHEARCTIHDIKNDKAQM